MQSKRNRNKNKDTARRDKNRTNKALGHSLKYQRFHMRWGTDKRTETGGQGRRTDDETAVQCFRKVLGQTAVAVAPDCSSRLAARCVRVCLSLCLSVHPACGILNF